MSETSFKMQLTLTTSKKKKNMKIVSIEREPELFAWNGSLWIQASERINWDPTSP